MVSRDELEATVDALLNQLDVACAAGSSGGDIYRRYRDQLHQLRFEVRHVEPWNDPIRGYAGRSLCVDCARGISELLEANAR